MGDLVVRITTFGSVDAEHLRRSLADPPVALSGALSVDADTLPSQTERVDAAATGTAATVVLVVTANPLTVPEAGRLLDDLRSVLASAPGIEDVAVEFADGSLVAVRQVTAEELARETAAA